MPEKETMQISSQLSHLLLPNYNPKSALLENIFNLIKKYDYFLLTTHISADADGLGSQIGLFFLLKHLKKNVVILNNEAPPEYLSFMIPKNTVQNIQDYQENNQALQELFKNRFVFILDSSEIKRSGAVGEAIKKAQCDYASIDHHILPPNERYLVDPEYPATSEIIWDLYKYVNIKILPAAAIALYAGIVADTGNFRYPKTSFRTHLAGGHLLSLGINSDFIYRSLYESQNVDRLFYLQRILKKIIVNKKLGFVVGVVKKNTKKGLELSDSPSEGIVNMLLAAKEIKVAALLTRTKDGHIKGSLRSIGDFDVAAIAGKLKGGGHKNAAGFKAEIPFRKGRKIIVREIEAALQKD